MSGIDNSGIDGGIGLKRTLFAGRSRYFGGLVLVIVLGLLTTACGGGEPSS